MVGKGHARVLEAWPLLFEWSQWETRVNPETMNSKCILGCISAQAYIAPFSRVLDSASGLRFFRSCKDSSGVLAP